MPSLSAKRHDVSAGLTSCDCAVARPREGGRTMEYSEIIIQRIWKKGKIVSTHKSSLWRKDDCGAWMKRDEFGNRDSEYGWEIDDISPGGPDALCNVRPLQWQNYVDKMSGLLKCNVTAHGVNNRCVG